jgi:hypothetical protein
LPIIKGSINVKKLFSLKAGIIGNHRLKIAKIWVLYIRGCSKSFEPILLTQKIEECVHIYFATVADAPSQSALRDALNGDFVVPKSRLKLGEKAFFVAIPGAWTWLPAESLQLALNWAVLLPLILINNNRVRPTDIPLPRKISRLELGVIDFMV